MRLLAIAVTAVALTLPGAAVAQANSLVLDPTCFKDSDGTQVYAVKIGVTNFPPNTPLTLRLEMSYLDGSGSGGIGPASFTTDASGNVSPIRIGTVGVPTVFTGTAVYSGGTLTKTVTVDDALCSKLHARDVCKFERTAIGVRAFRAKYGQGRFHRRAWRNCVRANTGV